MLAVIGSIIHRFSQSMVKDHSIQITMEVVTKSASDIALNLELITHIAKLLARVTDFNSLGPIKTKQKPCTNV